MTPQEPSENDRSTVGQVELREIAKAPPASKKKRETTDDDDRWDALPCTD